MRCGGTNFSTKSLISYKAGGATTTYTGGGMSLPCSTAVDGAGNIWVGNAGTYGVSEFTSAGVALSPQPGQQHWRSAGTARRSRTRTPLLIRRCLDRAERAIAPARRSIAQAMSGWYIKGRRVYSRGGRVRDPWSGGTHGDTAVVCDVRRVRWDAAVGWMVEEDGPGQDCSGPFSC